MLLEKVWYPLIFRYCGIIEYLSISQIPPQSSSTDLLSSQYSNAVSLIYAISYSAYSIASSRLGSDTLNRILIMMISFSNTSLLVIE